MLSTSVCRLMTSTQSRADKGYAVGALGSGLMPTLLSSLSDPPLPTDRLLAPSTSKRDSRSSREGLLGALDSTARRKARHHSDPGVYCGEKEVE